MMLAQDVETSSRLIIFEGPDGAGKTTAARSYAINQGAHYIHLGPFKYVDGPDLQRYYVEAMMPAVLGHRDVVMDRSWLSELPYGHAFRGGRDRLGSESRRLLERLALRCATSVILCLPAWETVLGNWRGRRGTELLLHETQLREVYGHYTQLKTSMPVTQFDYTTTAAGNSPIEAIKWAPRTRAHIAKWPTAGSLGAKVIMVMDKNPEHHPADCLYQWPGGSLSGTGASRWMARRLEEASIYEDSLMWVNAADLSDQLYEDINECLEPRSLLNPSWFAVGEDAAKRLGELGADFLGFPHPQDYKRGTYGGDPTSFMEAIKDAAQ